jgi:hypothetical protein
MESRPKLKDGGCDSNRMPRLKACPCQTIQRTVETDLPTTEDTDVSQDKPKKADRNLMAINCLTMAFQDDALLNIIELSETTDWPFGLAYKVIDELFKKY